MGTVRDLIHQAALLAGMRASGEVLDATTAQDLLTVLNQLIESWNATSLMIYQTERRVFVLQAGQQEYTVGPGGQFNMVRPVALHDVNWLDEAQTPSLELPLHELNEQEYHNLRVRETPSSQPSAFYYGPSFPLSTLFFYPKPLLTKKVVLFPWGPWRFDNTLDSPLAMPPGYERMLVHNLAVEYGQQPGARLTPQTVQIAQESKYWVETLNTRVPLLTSDYPQGSRGRFNFYQVDG